MKHDWKFGRPTKEGVYYCILLYDEYCNNNKTGRKFAEIGRRYFGDAETYAGWLMDGEPTTGLAWTEQCGSSYGEKVYAWTDTPPCSVDLPEGYEWDL